MGDTTSARAAQARGSGRTWPRRLLGFAFGGLSLLGLVATCLACGGLFGPKTAPAPYNAYPWLDQGVHSAHFEVARISQSEMFGLEVLDDTTSGSFILRAEPSNSSDQSSYYYWKVDKQGHATGPLRVSMGLGLLDSGVFFDADSYIDWIDSGSAAPKPYLQRLDADTLSADELSQLLSAAQLIDIDADYDAHAARIYLQSKEGWTQLSSKSSFAQLDDDPLIGRLTFSRKLPSIPQAQGNAPRPRFVPIESEDKPFEDWTEPGRTLRLEYFLRGERQSKPFYDINNHGRSGHHGEGYFALEHRGDTLHFKSYTFRAKGDYDPDISLVAPARAPQLLFLELRAVLNARERSRAGLYVVRPR